MVSSTLPVCCQSECHSGAQSARSRTEDHECAAAPEGEKVDDDEEEEDDDEEMDEAEGSGNDSSEAESALAADDDDDDDGKADDDDEAAVECVAGNGLRVRDTTRGPFADAGATMFSVRSAGVEGSERRSGVCACS